jgi:tripartite ATP-independent transporter DctP family solute receptor
MNTNLRKLFKGALVALLSLSILSGCGATKTNQSSGSNSATTPPASSNAKAITINVATVVSATHPTAAALQTKFKPLVEEGSGGAIKVQVHVGGVFGSEKELWDSVRNGNLDMVSVGSIMWNEVDKMLVPDWPFLFRDLDHARKVYTGDIGKEIAADVEQKSGVHFMGWTPNGARAFSSSKPLKTLEDFKGMRLRMPNAPIHLQVGKLLGANVTPLPMGEVFTALEQKVVDGQDNPMTTLRSEGWYEVQKYVFESNHMIPTLHVFSSDKLWKKLTEDQRKLLKEASLKTSEEAWNIYAKSIEEDRKFLRDKGLTVTIPDDATRQKFVTIVQPVYDDLFKKYPWAKDMYERIQKVK